MSDVRIGIQQMPEPSKSIGMLLMDFYDNMKVLELDANKGGKQATCIVMAINDVENIIKDNKTA